MSDTNDFIQELQGLVEREMRRAYGDMVYERWLYPRLEGSISEPDGYGRLTGSCDDTMEIFLKFENGTVLESRFRTSGCGTSLVCGSFAVEMALGKSPEELLEVAGEAILRRIGGLPADEVQCAFLAAATLQAAAGDYLKRMAKA